LRLFSFGGYGLALAALALMVFGAIECPPSKLTWKADPHSLKNITLNHTFRQIKKTAVQLRKKMIADAMGKTHSQIVEFYVQRVKCATSQNAYNFRPRRT